ncbi:hypothetical protein [Vreelandella aquamarina]|jgi:hypothetical protein|uniref:Uncharacterized protein n=1 Tax=Vreelandella aquamarina TaxID=77097 RepID=A0A1N6FCJ0_9GAMM|nr:MULTISPECIES: hypothetical protein [Halomonas]GED47560.1 hypothetical protein HME01_34120 [Halomonas meridiana]SIN61952.1 hypothetical protein SAMN05878249_0838 [Halomonas meridiana]SIN67834.1 hypothetical protein SAMN05878438_2271 [Halomonas meridiana]SIN92980.1 hypothetical protein SAMN05878442_0116 [Halomonas meridiana]|tara:strand:- start:269 stop:961 length:693 start_codon:yes stop_codon:yes gene_type:complete
MSKNPIDIKIECGVENSEGAIFVELKTLKELEEFWANNRERYFYAAQGIGLITGQVFLNDYEWIFGKTKEAIVKTLFRWDEMGVECEFYEWSREEPSEYKLWVLDRKNDRENSIKNGNWSEEEEGNYQEIYKREAETGCSGWWRLKILPSGFDLDEWSNPYGMGVEINDKGLSIEEVNKRIQIRTYDENKEGDWDEVRFHDKESIDDTINYWRSEKDKGDDYYGSENEVG